MVTPPQDLQQLEMRSFGSAARAQRSRMGDELLGDLALLGVPRPALRSSAS